MSVTDSVGNVATGISLGAGVIGYIIENPDFATAIIAGLSAVIALIFYILNYRINLKTLELNETVFKEEMKGMIALKGKNKLSDEQLSYISEIIEDMKNSRKHRNRKERPSHK